MIDTTTIATKARGVRRQEVRVCFAGVLPLNPDNFKRLPM